MGRQNDIRFRLSNLRESRGLSKAHIAEQVLDISADQYAKIESGNRGLKAAHAIALADFYGVSCDYILRGIESSNLDVCEKTALDQKTLDVLIDNKKNELYKMSPEDAQGLLNGILEKMENEGNYEAWKKLQNEYDQLEKEMMVTYATIRDYSISNEFLNCFIRDQELWAELRRAIYQYVTCMETMISEYEINNGRPSIEEALNQMGLDAAKYIAGLAFAASFSKIMKNANFYRSVSNLNDDEINELIKLNFIDDHAD